MSDVSGAGKVASTKTDVVLVGAGIMSADMGLSDWIGKHKAWEGHDQWVKDHDLWEQYQANPDACDVSDGQTAPDFCKAFDPGPEPKDPGPPPTDKTLTTADGGTVHTQLTLDGDYNVVTEKTTVSRIVPSPRRW